MTKDPFFLVITIFMCAAGSILAQPKIDYDGFLDGNKYVFRSLNHSKAKGLDVSIQIPETWSKSEGDRPNVVQKFTNRYSSYTIVALLIIKKMDPPPISKSEARELMSEIKDWLPEGASLVSSNSELSIDGEPAAVIEYDFSRSAESNPMNIAFTSRGLSYYIIYSNYIIHLQFHVGTTPPLSPVAEFGKYKPLFSLIATRLVINSKWK